MQIIHVCPMEIQPVWFAGRVVVENCQEYYFAKLKPSLSWAELKLHIQLAQAFGTSEDRVLMMLVMVILIFSLPAKSINGCVTGLIFLGCLFFMASSYFF